MKKFLHLLLALLLVTLPLGLCLPAGAAESGETFAYDFTAGFEGFSAEKHHNQITVTEGEGYVTFTATGDDPYFRFDDGAEPTPFSQKLAYAVIRYRTTATIGQGEFFTNRQSGPQWGGDRTHVSWDYVPDGEWRAVVVDCTSAWGGVTGDRLYAFRFDPLASGAKVGDSIDVSFIRFFASRAEADALVSELVEDGSVLPPPDPDTPVETAPPNTFTLTFKVDGHVVHTLTFEKGATSVEEPVVPARPGYTGAWEEYTLDGDGVVNAVYTLIDDTVPPMPDVTEAPTEAASETAPPADTELPNGGEITPAESTSAEEGKGCGAAVTPALCLPLLLLAAAVLRREKPASL